MEQQTESAVDDYYILFRDTGDAPHIDMSLVLQKINLPISSKTLFSGKTGRFFKKIFYKIFNILLWLWNIADNTPTKTPVPIDYAKRCEENDLLLADKASYVWGYVGKLTGDQARIVKNSLNSNVDKGLWLEYMSSVESSYDSKEIQFVHNPKGVISIVPCQPDALEFLAQVLPNFVFFRHVPLKHEVRIYPESAKEKRQILAKLMPCSTQKRFGFILHYDAQKVESTKRHRSFVELLSSETIMKLWQRFGHSPCMNVLRRTAGAWIIDTFEDRSVKRGIPNHPKNVKTIFQSALDCEEYIQALTPRQRNILWTCVDIVNEIREENDPENANFENKYETEEQKRHKKKMKAREFEPARETKKARRAKVEMEAKKEREMRVDVDAYYLQEMHDRLKEKELSIKLDKPVPASTTELVSAKSEKNTSGNIPPTQAASAYNPDPVSEKNAAETESAHDTHPTAYPHQIQAATGIGVPDIIEAYQASIEGSDGTAPNVNVVNQLTKKDIADGAFDGTRRALARFITPKDETQIEKVHRLRCDDVEWKYIGRTIYREENGKNIDEKDLRSYVDNLRKQHKRQYPEFYETEE